MRKFLNTLSCVLICIAYSFGLAFADTDNIGSYEVVTTLKSCGISIQDGSMSEKRCPSGFICRSTVVAEGTISSGQCVPTPFVVTLCRMVSIFVGKPNTNFSFNTDTLADKFAIFALVIIGLAFFLGKISWGMIATFILGVALVFGAKSIVNWIVKSDNSSISYCSDFTSQNGCKFDASKSTMNATLFLNTTTDYYTGKQAGGSNVCKNNVTNIKDGTSSTLTCKGYTCPVLTVKTLGNITNASGQVKVIITYKDATRNIQYVDPATVSTLPTTDTTIASVTKVTQLDCTYNSSNTTRVYLLDKADYFASSAGGSNGCYEYNLQGGLYEWKSTLSSASVTCTQATNSTPVSYFRCSNNCTAEGADIITTESTTAKTCSDLYKSA